MKKLLVLLPLMAMFAISSCSDSKDAPTVDAPTVDAPTVDGLKLSPETVDVVTMLSKTMPTLELVVTPAEAANQVVWTSDKPDVISVDAKGKLTLVKESTAKITITASAPSGKKATCVINMDDYAELKAGGYGVIDVREELGMIMLDRNIGATEAYDTATKKAESIGNYYQWGKNTPVAVGAEAEVNTNYEKEWNATGGSSKDWTVAANTPCPAGWALPSQEQTKLIGDKAWPDYGDLLGDQGLTSQTPAELEAAKVLFAKLKISMSGYWCILGADAMARQAATPTKTSAESGYFWSSAIFTGTPPKADRGFKFAYGISTNDDGEWMVASKTSKNSEVNVGAPIRCVKAAAAPKN